MIILHAGWLNHGLLLWGEMPAKRPPRSPARKGQNPNNRKPQPYCYGAGIDSLASSLQQLLPLKPSANYAQKAITWLPTITGQPIPSSTLIAETDGARSKTKLAPWMVSAYPLAMKEMVAFLCACMGKQILAPGVVIGSDSAYWAMALRFAGSLVARQQYLPGLRKDGNKYQACWEPVFAGKDIEQLTLLAKRMPPAARALSDLKTTLLPEIPAISVLRQFIAAMVDYLVRSAVTGNHKPDYIRNPKKSSSNCMHDIWLKTLRSPQPTITNNTNELARLYTQVQEWRRPLEVATASPLRLCFRLEEPEVSRPAWYVRYLLQPHDDPSLLIPVTAAWKSQGSKTVALERHSAKVQEYALASLGQAASICPYITNSLKCAQPDGYPLDTKGAHAFLSEKAGILEQTGFGVMLPAWWTRKGTKLKLAMKAKVRSPKLSGGNRLSLHEMVKFDWQLALGNNTLSFQELESLAKLKVPLVRIRGEWVEISAAEIQAAIDFWKKKSSDTATIKDVIQIALGAGSSPLGVELDGVIADGWIKKLLEQLSGNTALEELSAPDVFSGTLRPYQSRGFSWLAFLRQWGLGACLADDMGLGKTIQTLALIQRDWISNNLRPVLLICPTSLVNNWQKEAACFTPNLPVMIHHGITRKKGAAFEKTAQKQAMVISSYALLHRDTEHLQAVDWAGVILDEAQNIKNSETRQARAARSLKAEYRIALTGTPVENNVGDLWSIMEFLNPGFLGTPAEFKRNFFIPIQAGHDPEAATRLKRIMGPFILRRLKTDKSIISDLPAKQEMKVFCSLTKEQASLYAAVLKDMEKALKSSEGIQRKGIILATLSKLKQVCNHPAQFLGDNSSPAERSGKLNRLTEMLEEIILANDRALVFSQFSEMGKILQRHLQETLGQEVLFLHGGLTKPKRDRMIERFQNTKEALPIFLLSLKAGGTGLNLTRANHVFHFDRWWNPAVENQATDRVFRIGQTKNVQVHKFICAGTLEEKIDEMIESKQAVAEKVIGTGEGWLTELSNAELKNIFALRKDAIGE